MDFFFLKNRLIWSYPLSLIMGQNTCLTHSLHQILTLFPMFLWPREKLPFCCDCCKPWQCCTWKSKVLWYFKIAILVKNSLFPMYGFGHTEHAAYQM